MNIKDHLNWDGYPLALPAHLREKRHNDWIWPMSKIRRSWNARGPRVGVLKPGYLQWPPKLIEGRGVTRWENDGASSIIEIPALERKVTSDVYGEVFRAYEKNEGNPFYGKSFDVLIEYKINGTGKDGEIKSDTLNYSPSALQKFSDGGYMILSPTYKTWHKSLFGKSPNYGVGWRPDHVDIYYNFRHFYGGLNFE